MKISNKQQQKTFGVKNDVPQYVINGIKKGQQDIKAGRSLSLNEFKQKIGL